MKNHAYPPGTSGLTSGQVKKESMGLLVSIVSKHIVPEMQYKVLP
jgi:hypothetical protein